MVFDEKVSADSLVVCSFADFNWIHWTIFLKHLQDKIHKFIS